MTEEVKNFDLKMFLAFQRVIHSGSRKAIELSDVDELIPGNHKGENRKWH